MQSHQPPACRWVAGLPVPLLERMKLLTTTRQRGPRIKKGQRPLFANIGLCLNSCIDIEQSSWPMLGEESEVKTIEVSVFALSQTNMLSSQRETCCRYKPKEFILGAFLSLCCKRSTDGAIRRTLLRNGQASSSLSLRTFVHRLAKLWVRKGKIRKFALFGHDAPPVRISLNGNKFKCH